MTKPNQEYESTIDKEHEDIEEDNPEKEICVLKLVLLLLYLKL